MGASEDAGTERDELSDVFSAALSDSLERFGRGGDLSVKTSCYSVRDGYYFLPLIGVSWIPFKPLADKIIELGKEIRSLNEKLAPEFTTTGTFNQFCEYVDHITDYSWDWGGMMEAVQAAQFFADLAAAKEVSDTQKHAFFNAFPLALSANCAPGRSALMDEEPDYFINIEKTHDWGVGEYRGYLHFCPWIHVEDGMIVEQGIMKKESFRQNVSDGGTSQLQGFDLRIPTTSSGITPIPEWNLISGSETTSDWEDAMGGFLVYMKYGEHWWDFFPAGWEGVKINFKEHLLPFYYNEQDGRQMCVSGREVKFEMAQPNVHWHPKSRPLSDIQAEFELRHGGRVAREGQEMAKEINGRDVPWICLAINATIDSERGLIAIKFGGSMFPCHAVYLGVRYKSFFGWFPPTGREESSVWELLYEEDQSTMEDVVDEMQWASLWDSYPRTAEEAMNFIEVEFGADIVQEQWRNYEPGDYGGGKFPKSTFHKGRQKPRTQGEVLESFGDLQESSITLCPTVVITSR